MAKTYRKVAEFKTVEDFSAYLKSENINIGLVPEVPADGSAGAPRARALLAPWERTNKSGR